MQTFKICKKLNYGTESIEVKNKVDFICNYITTQLESKGLKQIFDNKKNINYIFSIGGDGTMLHTMSHNLGLQSIVVGINAGNVGFLTPYSITDILETNVLDLIAENTNLRIEKRSILEGSVKNKINQAVNDYAITSSHPNGMVELSIEIEHKGQISQAGNYKANALVVSGPCGSTAYNMNAGGAIIDPVVKCMQIVMVAPTTLGARSLIISKDSTIHLNIKNQCHVYSDGVLTNELNINDKISIRLLKKESHILVPQNWNFFSVLAKKLHWNNGKDVN